MEQTKIDLLLALAEVVSEQIECGKIKDILVIKTLNKFETANEQPLSKFIHIASNSKVINKPLHDLIIDDTFTFDDETYIIRKELAEDSCNGCAFHYHPSCSELKHNGKIPQCITEDTSRIFVKI